MAITENDILMQRVIKTKDGEGNVTSTDFDIFYPVTKGSNVLCDDGEEIEEKINQIQVKTFTIATSAWTLNSTTNLYEATITDTTVNSYDNADISFDATTYDIASEAGIKGYVTEIQSTGIKLFAESVPSASVSGKYNVERGVANG